MLKISIIFIYQINMTTFPATFDLFTAQQFDDYINQNVEYEWWFNNNRLLQWSLRHNRTDLIKKLANRPSFLDASDWKWLCCTYKHHKLHHMLADVNDITRREMIKIAARENWDQMLQFFLKYGNVNLDVEEIDSILEQVSTDNIKKALLCTVGNDITESAIKSANAKQFNALRLFIENGADCDRIMCETNVMEYILDINFVDEMYQILELILSNSRYGIKRDDYLLYRAVYRNNEELVKLLLSYGAEPDLCKQDSEYPTALLRAIRMGFANIVSILIDHRANPYITTRDGKTALELANNLKLHQISKLILDAVAKNKETRTTNIKSAMVAGLAADNSTKSVKPAADNKPISVGKPAVDAKPTVDNSAQSSQYIDLMGNVYPDIDQLNRLPTARMIIRENASRAVSCVTTGERAPLEYWCPVRRYWILSTTANKVLMETLPFAEIECHILPARYIDDLKNQQGECYVRFCDYCYNI